MPLGTQIGHALKDRGVRFVFGIPGVHNQELYRGLADSGITHILSRHEQGAGFMADGFARATGEAGVAFVITGPGLTNILTPVGQAYSDSIPMLVIASGLENDPAQSVRGRLHEMKDQKGAALAVADWCVEADNPDAVYALIDRAFSEFAVNRPRPKCIQIPVPALSQTAHCAPPTPKRPLKPIPNNDLVVESGRLLRKSKRPLFVFGGGAVGAANSARAIVAHVGAAVFMTYAGRGVIPIGFPLCIGSHLPRPESVEILKKSDLVIVVGSALSEVDLWRDELGNETSMIYVDIDSSSLFNCRCDDVPIQGEANAFLHMLDLEIRNHRFETEWSASEIRTARQKFRDSCELERPGIARIADEVLAALPNGTMVYSDMTQFAYVAKETVALDAPGRWHHPYGFGTLGYALPAAIGGKLGLPETPVLAVAGDYGFQYTMQELGTAAELGLQLPILIWDNAGLKEIEQSMIAAQIEPFAVKARNPDFLKLADAYGVRSQLPQSVNELKSGIHEAFSADGPSLIVLRPELLFQ